MYSLTSQLFCPKGAWIGLLCFIMTAGSCTTKRTNLLLNEEGSYWKTALISQCYLKTDKTYYEKWVFQDSTLTRYQEMPDGTYREIDEDGFDYFVGNNWYYRRDSLFLRAGTSKFKITKITDDSLIITDRSTQCKAYRPNGASYEYDKPTIFILSRRNST